MENNDFVRELGYLGFTMRLKRISDAMIQDGRRLYKGLDIDIEPNWFVIFKLLKKYNQLSVTEIANKIKMAHPSVISITNKMLDANYLTSKVSDSDSRFRVLELSDKALKRLSDFDEIWGAGTKAMETALKGMDALNFLEKMEDIFTDKGFKERTIEQYQKIYT